jgi:hypothetical protein
MKLNSTARWFVLGFLLLSIPAVLTLPASAQIGIGISVRIGPPALPVYEQPLCPGPGYLWTPGYWSWDDDDGYYWVPGTWVVAPVGLLWTPGYWGWNDGAYVWNAGYWGPEIGFYGGINYGFGYGGNGFYGGEWRGGTFFYNTAVTRVNTTIIRNVYVNKTVIVNNNSHVAFNGGTGGVVARPTARQEAYMHEQHTPPIAAQTQQREAASHNRALFASTNHGRPTIAASARPGEFSGKDVIAARAAGGTYHAPKMSPKEARASRPAENHAEAPRGEAGKPAARPEAKPEGRPAEKSAKTRAPETRAPEKRPAEKAANHPAAEPKTSEKPAERNTAKNNAMKTPPERENKNEKMATHENESRPSKPAPSRAANKPPAEKPHATEPRAENKPASKPKPESRASTPAAEKSRLSSEPHAENRPAAKPSAPKESASKPSAARPAPAPKPAKEPKEPKGR